jgi:hypothetical protein
LPSDPWLPYEESVQRQAIFLSNPLPSGEGVCSVCRQSISGDFDRCYQCNQHRQASDLTADVVVPISYAVKHAQHAYNLASYKSTPASGTAQASLLSLGGVFLRDHLPCLRKAVAGTITHLVMVPSTKGRQGPHPLDKLLGPLLQALPRVPVRVNVAYNDRSFHADWFQAAPCESDSNVLVLDDTWTTGSRIQSLSHALKSAGASSVAAVVLGRHVNPDWDGSKPLLERIRGRRYDPSRCALDG